MSNNTQTPDRLLHEIEAADLLALSPRTLRNWRALGQGPSYIKLSGRCIRYRLNDLIEFVDSKSQHNAPDHPT